MNLKISKLCQEQCQNIGVSDQIPINMKNILNFTVKVQIDTVKVTEIAKAVQQTDKKMLIKSYFPFLPNVVSYEELQKMSPCPPIQYAENCKYIIIFNNDAQQDQEITIPYNLLTRQQLMSLVLPPEEFAASFEQIGHIAHYNFFSNEQQKYKHFIGLITLNKNTTTVILKTGEITNEFRTFDFELIAGQPKYETTLIQNNFKFTLDFQKVYWNSRLGDEHTRMVERIVNAYKKMQKQNTFIFDATGGVGPFAVPLAKKQYKVVCNDLNDVSYKYLKINVLQNGVANNVICRNEDCKVILEQFLQKEQQLVFNNMSYKYQCAICIINLPELSIDFLKVYRNLHPEQSIIPIVYFLECFVRTDVYYVEDAIIRLLFTRFGFHILIKNNHLGLLHANTVKELPDEACDCNVFPIDFLQQNQIKLRQLQTQFFQEFDVQLVRTVSTNKYMICCQLQFNENEFKQEFSKLGLINKVIDKK